MAPAAAVPRAQRLGDDEKEVLARSSRVAGKTFYPYLNDGQRERFHYDAPWEDPDGLLALSDKQRQHFGRWARPHEFVRGEAKMIYLVSALSITQTIITDCSFVSSLVIAAAYERRHGKQLLTHIIYPQDRRGLPLYNPSGKYVVRLHLNGIERKVVVDDRLPLSRDGQLMTSHTTHPQELWVSIIEKAYMKVNGGYDFPGSNSGIDMFALTGWVPEQFRTDDAGFDEGRLWERMLSASKYGDCLLTVATGELREMGGEEEERIGLVSTHAYAVLQVREVLGLRLLMLKNPWAKLRWKGSYSAHDTKRWTAELKRALAYDPAAAAQADNGVFWIDYGSLTRFFQGICARATLSPPSPPPLRFFQGICPPPLVALPYYRRHPHSHSRVCLGSPNPPPRQPPTRLRTPARACAPAHHKHVHVSRAGAGGVVRQT